MRACIRVFVRVCARIVALVFKDADLAQLAASASFTLSYVCARVIECVATILPKKTDNTTCLHGIYESCVVVFLCVCACLRVGVCIIALEVTVVCATHYSRGISAICRVSAHLGCLLYYLMFFSNQQLVI